MPLWAEILLWLHERLLTLIYMFGLRISRLMLAEIIVHWNINFGHISIFKGGVAEIFKNIGDEYDNLLINIEIYVYWDHENLGPLHIAKKIELSMSCHVLELHYKIESLKGRIRLFKKWLGLWLVNTGSLNTLLAQRLHSLFTLFLMKKELSMKCHVLELHNKMV